MRAIRETAVVASARNPRIVRLISLPALVLVLAVGACTSSDGQGRATKELTQTAETMGKASSYRFDATITTSADETTHVVGEFQAPDRTHQTITPPKGAPIEVVFLGAKAFVKDQTTGQWVSRVDTQPSSGSNLDPRAAFNALAKATDVRKQNETSYEFTLKGEAARIAPGATGAASEQVRAIAQVKNGHITRLDLPSPRDPAVKITILYSGFGAAPPVTEPVLKP